MTPELTDLARRAVACKGWRWMPGMKDLGGWRLVRALPDGGWDAHGGWEFAQVAHHPTLPDLTDSATIGCLLSMYDEARPSLAVLDAAYTYVAFYGLTHARTIEALIRALEQV